MESGKEGHEEKEAVETKVIGWQVFGSNFISQIRECAYEFKTVGQVEAGTNHILWTLRIANQNPKILCLNRDIPFFKD